jgi:hypothetical protein
VLVGVGEKVAVAVCVAVGVLDGVSVGVGVDEAVAVGVCVAVGVSDGVSVGVGVDEAVADGVSVAVGVLEEVAVSVAVCVAVGVGVVLLDSVTTSCGGWLPCRDEKITPSVLSAASTKLNVPLPVTADVTLYSTHVPPLTAPLLSSAPLVREGRLFQVMPVSIQDEPVVYTAGPLAEPLEGIYTRSRAL